MSVAGSDILVIGGGIAGASAAAAMASDGARVCVLEAEPRPDYHSSGRSAAIYIQNFGNAAIRGLTAASHAFFAAPPAGFAAQPLASPRGVLTVASASQLAAFQAVLDAASGMQRIACADALAMVPVLRADWLAAAALEPGALDIDVHAMHLGYQRQLKAAGGRLLCDAPVQELARHKGLWTAQTPQGRFSAPIVVNAAGAWADDIARLAGVAPLGLEPRRRTAIIIDMPPDVDATAWPMVFDAAGEFYFKPESGKLLLSPADATLARPGDVQPEELDVAIAVDRLEQAVNLTVERVTHSWAGLRTFAPDGALVLGWDAQAAGFFWVAGQGGYGFQTAPMAARAAADLLAGKGLPSALLEHGVTEHALAPTRFAAQGAG